MPTSRASCGTGVDGAVRNAALKKLFSDPHFNVMDGLDTYIDDYGKPDPLPLTMLRRMRQSAALGLFEDDPVNVPTPARSKARLVPMVPPPARWHSRRLPHHPRATANPVPKTTLICDCNRTMPIDGPALARALER